jgi:hypothetical protein
MIVVGAAYQTGTVTTLFFTDNRNGEYTYGSILGSPVAGSGAAYGYSRVIFPGSTTVTATFDSTELPDTHGLCILEYRGVNTGSAVDVVSINSQTTPGSGTDAVTSNAVVTTANHETVLGFLWPVESVTVNINPGTTPNPWVSRAAQTSGAVQRGLCEEFAQTTAGSIAATGGLSSGTTENTVVYMVALKNSLGRAALSQARAPITQPRAERQ